MNWELLLIPLIALGVWILSHIFRGAEDQRQQERARAIEENSTKRVPPRPMTDLDRFLAEARQRRKPAEGEEAKPVAAPTHLPIERARRRPPRTDRPQPQRQTLPMEPKLAPLPVAIPVVLPEKPILAPLPPLPPPPALPILPKVKEPPAIVVPVPVPTPVPAEPVVVPVMPRESRPRPVLAQLERMLRDRTALQTAILLQEILGPPKAKRG